jgi:UDP-GlcNAc3NAcA epimerase
VHYERAVSSVKVVTVVGARPQFVKAAPVSRALAAAGVTEVVVDTGQHYDHRMRDVFFEELGLAKPAVDLEVGSGSHAEQTAAGLVGIERVLLREQPDWVLVYGDTNATLSGALAAAKLQVPVAHVEAGLRSGNRSMPEEINRLLVDRVSTCLFCPSRTSVENLAGEGIRAGVFDVGDVMVDSLQWMVPRCRPGALTLPSSPFAIATIHRA